MSSATVIVAYGCWEKMNMLERAATAPMIKRVFDIKYYIQNFSKD